MTKPSVPKKVQLKLLQDLEAESTNSARFLGTMHEGSKIVSQEGIQSPIKERQLEAITGLLVICAEVIRGIRTLLEDSNLYSTAALSRQLVETEYLMWAFSVDHSDAEVWLTSSRSDRLKIFRSKTLRDRSDGIFPDRDYSAHCEFGGHPTPNGFPLTENREDASYAYFCDVVGHARGILGFLRTWARQVPPVYQPLEVRLDSFDAHLERQFRKFCVTNVDRGLGK